MADQIPFVASVVDCDGTSVRGNLINVAPDPELLHLGSKVRLATYVAGTGIANVCGRSRRTCVARPVRARSRGPGWGWRT
jgi:hypothetical protein